MGVLILGILFLNNLPVFRQKVDWDVTQKYRFWGQRRILTQQKHSLLSFLFCGSVSNPGSFLAQLYFNFSVLFLIEEDHHGLNFSSGLIGDFNTPPLSDPTVTTHVLYNLMFAYKFYEHLKDLSLTEHQGRVGEVLIPSGPGSLLWDRFS